MSQVWKSFGALQKVHRYFFASTENNGPPFTVLDSAKLPVLQV